MSFKTATFSDFFKSHYYQTTYLRPVDISDQALSKHLLEPELAKKIQQVLIPVQEIFSQGLSFDFVKIREKIKQLEANGFNALSVKPNMAEQKLEPFYSVVESPSIPGWVIKSAARRVPKDTFAMGPMDDRNEMAFFEPTDSLLRVEMADRIRKIAKTAGIDVVIPQKRLVAYANTPNDAEPMEKYCVVCEKIDVLSSEQTVQTINNMETTEQKELAQRIISLIEKTGLVDTSFDNFRLTSSGKLALIDTEPGGLMVAKEPGLWNTIFSPRGASVEKSARIGLFMLAIIAEQEGLQEIHIAAKDAYDKAVNPKFSAWKIGLSVASLGIIPVINAVQSIVYKIFSQSVLDQLVTLDQEVNQELTKKEQEGTLSSAPVQEYLEEYKAKRASIIHTLASYVEDVPYVPS